MENKLIRDGFGADFTEGKLFVDGVFECYTVEDTDRKLEEDISKKVYGQSAIPRGTYEIILSMSPRFKRIMPEIVGVPGFEGVRIHTGNSSKDTEGCIILGQTNDRLDDNWIGGSRAAEDAFVEKLKIAIANGEKVTLEIS